PLFDGSSRSFGWHRRGSQRASGTTSRSQPVTASATAAGFRESAWDSPFGTTTQMASSGSGMPNGSLSPFTTRTRAPPSAAARNSAARAGGLLDPAIPAAARNSAARAGGSAVPALPATARRPGGRSGNASAMTPLAPTAAAVRQATRAPLLRPPTISGVPGLSGTPSGTSSGTDHGPDHGPDQGLPRRKAMISRHASSWRAGEPGALAPLIRYGWVTSAVAPFARRAASRTASRSGALTEPPAPCVSTRRN